MRGRTLDGVFGLLEESLASTGNIRLHRLHIDVSVSNVSFPHSFAMFFVHQVCNFSKGNGNCWELD